MSGQALGAIPSLASAHTTPGTRRLLGCGMVAGPMFVTVTAIDALARDGFDLRQHGISLLSLGDSGWIQVTNFVMTGLLSISFGEGVRRLWAGQRGGTSAPLLIWAYGLGLIGTGLFLVDPGLGFPPGTPDALPGQLSWHGAVHAAAPPVAFLSLFGLTVLFAGRFVAARRWGWAAWSLLTGLAAMALIFWPGGGGSIRSAMAVLVTSAWLTAVARDLVRGAPT